MVMLAPSILSADFSRLGLDIELLDKAGVDYIHIDVMDGVFVPNLTFGAPIIKSLRNITKLPFDVHLMIINPDIHIKDFVEAGADIITVHVEACTHLHRTIQYIKSFGIKAGVSINPATPISTLEHIFEDIDLLLLMTVNPGFGGQSFIPQMANKIIKAREMIDLINPKVLLEVDGGVKLTNLKKIIDSGADIVVAGSAIFGSEDVEGAVKSFKSAL